MQKNGGYALALDSYSAPGGDIDGVTAPPGKQGMVGGQSGVVRAAGPVIADSDQSSTVSGQTRGGSGISNEGSIGTVGRIQIGNAVLRRRGQGQGRGQSDGGQNQTTGPVFLLQEKYPC